MLPLTDCVCAATKAVGDARAVNKLCETAVTSLLGSIKADEAAVRVLSLCLPGSSRSAAAYFYFAVCLGGLPCYRNSCAVVPGLLCDNVNAVVACGRFW